MIEPVKSFDGFNVTFNTGESCNLACTYCYEVNKKNTKLDVEYAKKFIDLILSDPDIISIEGQRDDWILYNGLILDFIGGDSLMFPDLIEQILKYYIKESHRLNHRWKDRWRVSISTNGTLFGRPDVRRFLEKWKNVISLSVSIDGCPAIHDKNRIYPDGKGSMNDIIKNFDWYREVFPLGSLVTKSTLNKDSIPYLFDSLVFMHKDLGLKYINQNFIFENADLQEKDLEEFDKQMEICTNYVYQHKDDLFWGMLDKRFFHALSYEKNTELNPNTSWCGSGAMPALSVDGKIYPCFRFLPHTQETKIDMSVGDIWNGITKKENFVCIRNQTREKISPEKCKQCPIESACAWCIAGSYSEKGVPFRQTYICDIIKIQAKWAILYWNRVYKERGEKYEPRTIL